MSRSKRRLCGALALLILLGGALAESTSEPTASAAQAPTAAASTQSDSTPEPSTSTQADETPETTASTQPDETPETTASTQPDETPEPGASTQPDETPEPGASPEPDASTEPDLSSEPTASTEPDETPDPDETPEPGASPEPEAPASAIQLKPEGDARQVDQIWQIVLSDPGAQFAFTWTEVPDAERIHVQISDSNESVLLSQDMEENRIALSPADYAEGPYTLRVEAWAGEVLLCSDATQFVLAQGDPGGRPSGGRPSGGSGGRSGGGSGGGGEGVEEQGFRITPGEALTSSHASGSGDMHIYGTVALELSDGEMTRLTLGEDVLELTLDGGAAFTGSIDQSTLRLETVAQGARWEIKLSALQTLNRSGIASLTLASGDGEIRLPTDLELCGSIYGMLRAQGLVTKDFTLELSAEERIVCVGENCYLLTADGELAMN